MLGRAIHVLRCRQHQSCVPPHPRRYSTSKYKIQNTKYNMPADAEATEETPLLRDAIDPQQEVDCTTKKSSSIAWRLLLAVAVLLVVAVLVKSWIEADVDASANKTSLIHALTA